MRSQGKVSPERKLLEQLFDMVVGPDCEARLGMSYGHKAGEIGVNGNGYKPDGFPNASGSSKLLVTKISYLVDTPLLPNAMNSGLRDSESTWNFAIECHN